MTSKTIRTVLRTAGLVASVGWIVGSIGTRTAWVSPRRGVGPDSSGAEEVRFPSADGLRLAASFWHGAGANAPAVLILPGLATTRHVFAPNAAWFAARGYAVLTLDLRGHGDSACAQTSFGWTEAQDAHAALAWLKRRQGGAPVAVIGVSMGGAATLLGPAGPLRPDALVLQAAYATFRRTVRNRIATFAGLGAAWVLEPLLSLQTWPRLGVGPGRLAPVARLRGVTCPVFVIGGEKDRFTPPDETRDLFDAAPGPKRLWIAPGLGHCGISETTSAAYRERVLAFLEETIGRPS